MSSNPTTETNPSTPTNREIVMSIGKQFLVMLVVAFGIMFWINDRYDWSKHPAKMFGPEQAEPVVTAHPDFLAICSGMKITPQTEPAAIANCMGQVGGFVAGYETAVTFADADGRQMMRKPLWCRGDQPMTNGQLYNVVARWAAAHPDRVIAQVELYGATHPTATQTIFIAALHETYPCQ